MTYAVQQDLIDRFGNAELLEVADRDDDQVIDAAVVGDALTDADELINGYIASRYDLPFTTAPAFLTKLAADVARYYLFKDDPPEQVVKGYEDAVRTLKAIARGEVVLEVAGAAPAEALDGVKHSAPDRVFDAGTLKGFG